MVKNQFISYRWKLCCWFITCYNMGVIYNHFKKVNFYQKWFLFCNHSCLITQILSYFHRIHLYRQKAQHTCWSFTNTSLSPFFTHVIKLKTDNWRKAMILVNEASFCAIIPILYDATPIQWCSAFLKSILLSSIHWRMLEALSIIKKQSSNKSSL